MFNSSKTLTNYHKERLNPSLSISYFNHTKSPKNYNDTTINIKKDDDIKYFNCYLRI